MAAPLSKKASRAVQLLSTPHPQEPSRCYTITEVAKKTGVARTTIYRHIERAKGEGK